MLAFIAAIAYLTVTGLVGVAALRRARLGLTPLEIVAFGIPLGGVLSTLVLLVHGIVFGLTTSVVGLLALISAATAFALWPERERWLSQVAGATRGRALPLPSSSLGLGLVARADWGGAAARWRDLRPHLRYRAGWLPTLVLIAVGIRWVIYYSGVLTFNDDGELFAGHIYIWWDWTFHLSDVSGFAYGDNFPPENLLVQGKPYAYHFLASLATAALIPLGLSLTSALPVASGFYFLFLLLGFYTLARRLIGNHGAAVLAVVLACFGGGVAWLPAAKLINEAHDIGQVLLHGNPWRVPELQEAGYAGGIPFLFSVPWQRAYLFGLPLALLTITLLLIGTSNQRNRVFLAAGFVAGLMPLAHLSSMLALALITPFLFVLFPSRRWFLALPIFVVLALPQTLWVVGSGGGAASALRVHIGWMARDDPLWLFWLKNLGLFIPLLLVALFDKTILPPRSRRFLWAFMPIFLLINLFAFAPWAGENEKILVFWFLATCIFIAAMLMQAWQRYGTLAARALVASAVIGLTLAGAVATVDQMRGMDRYHLLSAEEIELTERLRRTTPLHSVFIAGMQHVGPVPMLTGRPVVLAYPPYAWAHGTPTPELEADVRAILRFDPTTPELLAKHDVSYVVIGPVERERYQANDEAFQARYPVVIQTENSMSTPSRPSQPRR